MRRLGDRPRPGSGRKGRAARFRGNARRTGPLPAELYGKIPIFDPQNRPVTASAQTRSDGIYPIYAPQRHSLHSQAGPGSAAVHCALTVGTGSRDEQPAEHGMAHLLEHAFFKGTERRRAYHINCRLENLGGELNAYTTKEETVIHTTTLRPTCPKRPS